MRQISFRINQSFDKVKVLLDLELTEEYLMTIPSLFTFLIEVSDQKTVYAHGCIDWGIMAAFTAVLEFPFWLCYLFTLDEPIVNDIKWGNCHHNWFTHNQPSFGFMLWLGKREFSFEIFRSHSNWYFEAIFF